MEPRQEQCHWVPTDRQRRRDGTERPCVHEAFEAQAAQTPDATAIVFEDDRLTYGELNQQANRLARYLRKLGVGPEDLVGLCMARCPWLIVGILGILKAGAAYVPLEPGSPAERLGFIVEDTQMRVLLTQQALLPILAGVDRRVICLDRQWMDVSRERGADPRAGVTGENLAYVMYTSGSTGRPKGVEIPHRGIIRLVVGLDYFQSGPEHVFLQAAPISFDASTFEIWGALLHGAGLVLFPGRLPTADSLRAAIDKHGVTTMWLTPTLFNGIFDEAPDALTGLQQLVIGGEPLSVSHIHRALRQLPNTQIINGYGPTENSDFTCCYPIPATFPDTAPSVPIGRPIGGDTVYLLDAELQPVAPGTPGELCVSGAGLARGYHNRPELTAARFIPDPFSGRPGQRLYRTGDQARDRGDGVLEFLGRIDGQVKIRGFRVELGDVEATLTRHPAVRQAIVVLRAGTTGGPRLVAYVTCHAAVTCSARSLRQFLGDKLPEYMIPSAFVVLDAFPLNPHGKADRTALPEPSDAPPADLGVAHVEPVGDMEVLVASVWKDVLGVERVGAEENFGDLGGTSLLIRAVQVQLEFRLSRRVPITALFEWPTVRGLARHLSEGGVESAEALRARVEARLERRRHWPRKREAPHDE